jgi:beta-lactamase class A
MLTVFDQIKEGKLDYDTVMKSGVPELNKRFAIASDEAELKEGTVQMSVKEALDKMITISHNYAALLLTARVRLTTVNQELVKYKLTESKLDPPMATASDILKFYELLYNGELIDKSYSKAMLDLLLRQQLNDRIPKYLPNTVPVAHKTGEIEGFKHDAGIVYTKNGDYIIVILSRSTNPLAAAEREAVLSRDVYNYFLKR